MKARKASPFIGFIAGLIGSVVGVGGGTLIVPMIALFCTTIPQRVISGTSLAPVISTGDVNEGAKSHMALYLAIVC